MTDSTDDRPRWRLDQLYASLHDRRFLADTERVQSDVARLGAWFDQHDIGAGESLVTSSEHARVVADAMTALDDALRRQRRVRAYVHARTTTDAFDADAATTMSRLVVTSGAVQRLAGRLDGFIGRLDIDELIRFEPHLSEHKHTLAMSKLSARHRMSDAEESLALDLGLDGQVAWRQMRDQLEGRLEVPIAGPVSRTVPMAEARGMATHGAPDVRDAALDAELATWQAAEHPLAAALNAFVGAQSTLNTRRGWPDDLAPALHDNGIEPDVLRAMNDAVTEHLEDFARFCRAKAGVLRNERQLRWADLVAPVGAADDVPWNEAVELVTSSFATFSPQLAALVNRAIDDGWIDAESRAGKRGGAFCMPVEGDVSRVLMNYDHSADAIQTLAHELGHAFHNARLAGRTEFQRRTPRALAETASILCETIVTEALLDNADEAAELSLLNTDLSGATQVVVDIRSRFVFEQELYTARRRGTVPAAALCEMMVEAQAAAYTDGVSPDTYHPYMWAVKPHYYTPFYNVPYTFGLLLGLGLAERWTSDPERFVASYDDLLSRTAMATAVELAAELDIDLRSLDFWNAGLGHLARRIDRFVELAADA